MAVPKKFRSIHDLAEAELAQTAGSLVRVPSGVVWREGHSAPWDMQKEWRGRALVHYPARHSTWGNTTRISLHCHLNTELGYVPLFYVTINGKLTEEETAQMAGVFIMALNMRRVE